MTLKTAAPSEIIQKVLRFESEVVPGYFVTNPLSASFNRPTSSSVL